MRSAISEISGASEGLNKQNGSFLTLEFTAAEGIENATGLRMKNGFYAIDPDKLDAKTLNATPAGKKLSEYPEGRFFDLIRNCALENFNFESLSSKNNSPLYSFVSKLNANCSIGKVILLFGIMK